MSSQEWDQYWSHNRTFNFFERIYIYLFLCLPLRHSFERFFPATGVFLEAGCGSASDVKYIKKKQRQLVGIDYSTNAVRIAGKQKNMDKAMVGDILKLRFKNESFDGIWNLGVMEHFSKREIDAILQGFHRVLKKNGVLILFWPAKWNFANHLFPRRFPAMPSILSSKTEAKEILKKNNFAVLAIKATLVGDYIIVGKKVGS